MIACLAVRILMGPAVLDDAYITFRYSDHLVKSGELSYNTADRVLGTTTPLYTVLLAGARALGIPFELAALAFATLSDLITIAVLFGIVAAAGYRIAGIIVGLAIAMLPFFVTYSISGMETSLYVCILSTAVWSWMRNKTIATGALCGLAVLCRPDGALMAGLICGLLLLKNFRAGMKASLIAASFVLPWVVFTMVYFGSPVPQSLIAKAAVKVPPFTGLHNFAGLFLSRQYVVLTPLAVWGAVLLWRARQPALRIWVSWWVLYSVAFIVKNAFTDYPWYYTPLLPLYFAGIGAALETILRWAIDLVERHDWTKNHWSGWLAHADVAVLVLAMLAGALHLGAYRRSVEIEQSGRERLYAAVAQKLAAENPSCTLAATEIGALGFNYPGRILDLVGLVSPEAVGRDNGEVLLNSDAKWLVTYDTHFLRSIVASAGFAGQFRRVSVYPVAPGRNLEVYQRLQVGAREVCPTNGS
jgi:hypothetical protein